MQSTPCQGNFVHSHPRLPLNLDQCNEEQPVCRNCNRLDIQCSFSAPATPAAPSPSSALLAAIRNGEEDAPLPLTELELMHNLITKTIPSFQPTKERHNIFVKDYIRLSFTKTYLLHTMLALSALHLFHQDRSRKDLVSRASAHQDAALRLVQPILANLTADESIGVFAFSGLTAIYATAEANLHGETDPNRDAIEDMLSYIHLSQGIKAVIGPHWPFLSNSWLKPVVMYQDHRDFITPAHEESYRQPLRLVLDLVEQEDEETVRQSCQVAITRCFEYIYVVSGLGEDHEEVRLIQTWPVEVGKEFTMMLAAREPLALIILAHFAVLAGTRPGAWWMVGLPTRLFQRIEHILGDTWSEALAWPKMMIYGNRGGEPGLKILADATLHNNT